MKTLQPNSQHCFVCGLENRLGLKLRFFQTGPSEATVETTISEEYQGYPGVVHGGIVAAILDEVTGRSLMGNNPPRFMYTARLEVRYRNHVPVGEPIRIVGKAVKIKRQTAQAVGEIYDQDGNLLAEAEALLVNIPEEMIQPEDLINQGWKVYPLEDEIE